MTPEREDRQSLSEELGRGRRWLEGEGCGMDEGRCTHHDVGRCQEESNDLFEWYSYDPPAKVHNRVSCKHFNASIASV